MAGHSKWKNIQHRKGAQDIRKGKIFTKLIKEIMVAVKTGGADPEGNTRLRAAILSARGFNMPKDNVDRAIKKATSSDADNYDEVNYEGFGPHGVAIFVEAATNNVTRTVANIRSYFTKSNGSLGKEGCLQFTFQRKGVFVLEDFDPKVDRDEFTLDLIDHGASDVEFVENQCTIVCSVEDFGNLQQHLQTLQLTPQDSGLQRIPVDFKEVTGEEFDSVMKLIEKIEGDDDVQKVYHNILFTDELAKRMEE